MDKIVKVIPQITVLMPVYNCALYIEESVESVLNQTYTNFEFLIIDDASTDNTVSIIKTYTDSRIRLIEKPLNTGYTNSLNLGLQLARGKYIARMDGDDISLPERFEKQAAFLEANSDIALCGTALRVIGSDIIICYPKEHNLIKLNLLKRNCIIHPSVMLRKSILDQYSFIYDIAKEPAEDYDLWTRLSAVSKLYNLQEVLLNYRMHKSQVSQIRNYQQIVSSNETKLNLLNHLNFEKSLKKKNLLMKIISGNQLLNFEEIKLFKKIKIELLVANSSCYFDALGFENYLAEIENEIVNKYFFKRSRYFPYIYFQFLIIKRDAKLQFTHKQKFKLFVKSMLFLNA